MARGKPKLPGTPARQRRARVGAKRGRRPPKFGGVLLDLRDSLALAEQCRRVLKGKDFSGQRWLEIVKDVDPDLRFMARLQILDAIVVYLQSAGKPVNRETLARDMAMQKVATLERIQQRINTSLRSGKLALFPDHKIGLPEWKSGAAAAGGKR
jgi:hypothetical protein